MRKSFAPTVDFSAFSMRRTIIIGPEFMVPWQKSVCTVLQAAGLLAGHRRENQPCYSPENMLPWCMANSSRASSMCPSERFPQHRHPAAPSRVMTSKPLHKGHQLGMAALPCQPRAHHSDSRDKGFDTPTPGWLPLSPLSRGCVDKTNDPRPSESAQMY